MKRTEQEVRGELLTVAGSSPYCTVRNTRESESAVCHYINHLRHKQPKAVVTFSLFSTVVRLMRQSCCWPPGLTHRPAHSRGPPWHWVSRRASFPPWAEPGWPPQGLSPQTADSSEVREGVSDGVTCELRSPKGLEGCSEQGKGGSGQ